MEEKDFLQGWGKTGKGIKRDKTRTKMVKTDTRDRGKAWLQSGLRTPYCRVTMDGQGQLKDGF